MSAMLEREGTPLSPDQWRQIDEAVVSSARRVLVGRQFIPVAGPFGLGAQVLPHDTYSEPRDVSEPYRVAGRTFREVPMLHRDFEIDARDLETAAQYNLPLDTGAAVAAALACAAAEDHMVFHGRPDLGLPGLLTGEGTLRLTLGDWSASGAAFADTVQAVAALAGAGHPGPYALAVGPARWAALHRMLANAGVLEADQVRHLLGGGVYQTPALGPGQAVLVATGAHNLDLAVAQDLAAAYLETSRLVHTVRVLESLVLRIKRPGAIAVLG